MCSEFSQKQPGSGKDPMYPAETNTGAPDREARLSPGEENEVQEAVAYGLVF